MVPTEVLARQHFESVTELFEKHGVDKNVVLITGSMTAKEKRIAYGKIASHEADMIIGTHALIQEKVVYDNLALVQGHWRSSCMGISIFPLLMSFRRTAFP